jgi:hypothetical protein
MTQQGAFLFYASDVISIYLYVMFGHKFGHRP